MGAAIRDDFVEKSEAKEDFVEKEGGDSFGGDGFLGRAKNYPLSKPMVYHDHERIKAGGHREISDKIAGDLLKGARGDGFNGRKGGYSGVCVNLVLLAKGTAFDVLADEGGESGPPELGGNQLSGFQEAGVSGGFMVVTSRKDGAAEGVVGGDINMALISEDAGFNLPVGQPGTEGKRDVLMHGLESLEDKGVTRGRRLNAVGEGGVDEVDNQGRREEGDVGVIRIIGRKEVGSARESVGSGKEFSGDMDHLKVEVGEVNEPACLAAIECLRLVEIGEVLVVSKDLHREGGAMEIMVPGF